LIVKRLEGRLIVVAQGAVKRFLVPHLPHGLEMVLDRLACPLGHRLGIAGGLLGLFNCEGEGTQLGGIEHAVGFADRGMALRLFRGGLGRASELTQPVDDALLLDIELCPERHDLPGKALHASDQPPQFLDLRVSVALFIRRLPKPRHLLFRIFASPHKLQRPVR